MQGRSDLLRLGLWAKASVWGQWEVCPWPEMHLTEIMMHVRRELGYPLWVNWQVKGQIKGTRFGSDGTP